MTEVASIVVFWLLCGLIGYFAGYGCSAWLEDRFEAKRRKAIREAERHLAKHKREV